MALYREHIFPILLNAAMDGEPFREVREKVLKDLAGTVLEIGFGTGLNLPFYPPAVRKLIAVEPEKFRERYLSKVPEAGPAVEFVQAPGEALPIASGSVDHVVTTWTLCSVGDPAKVLSEIARVLKPGGTFVFVEHGRAPTRFTASLQDWLTPLQKCVGRGCHLNRKIDEIVANSPLKIERMENFYIKGPKIASYLYSGEARKA